MKVLAIISLLLLTMIPVSSLAEGPDGRTVSVDIIGNGGGFLLVHANFATENTPSSKVYVTSTGGFTFSAWRYDPRQASWNYVKFTGMAGADTAHVSTGLTVPIEGKYDLIFFASDAGIIDIDVLAYQ
jgi:hypothetical protein